MINNNSIMGYGGSAIKLIIEKILTVLSLPCGYRSKSIYFIIGLLSLILITIIYSSGIYLYISSNKIFVEILIVSVSAYTIFLKFNFVVRFYNAFIRSSRYFYYNGIPT